MRPNDRKAFLEVVLGFAELKGRQLSAPALELYWNSMQDWSIEDFRSAANTLIKSCEYMPTPKEFNDLRKALKPSGATAWFTKGTSPDPLANKAMQIAAQGRYVGHIPIDELQWVQKRFIEVYEELLDKDEAQVALPHLKEVSLEFHREIAGLLNGKSR